MLVYVLQVYKLGNMLVYVFYIRNLRKPQYLTVFNTEIFGFTCIIGLAIRDLQTYVSLLC